MESSIPKPVEVATVAAAAAHSEREWENASEQTSAI